MEPFNKILEKSFRENWNRAALSNYQGETLCYKDLAASIARLHILFDKVGLKKGDRVALCARNQAGWGVCFLATLTYGAVPVPLLHEFKPDNVHYLVNHSEAKVLFVDDVIWEGLSETEMPGLILVPHVNAQKLMYAQDETVFRIYASLSELFDIKYPEGFGPSDIDYYEDKPEDLALINYTSGTSGFSKGVMLPYRSLSCNLYFATYVAEPQLCGESEVVAMLPSAHMYGLMFEFLFEISRGAHVHFLTRVPSPKIILNAFRQVHPEIIVAVPLIIEKVFKSQIKPVLDSKKTLLRIPVLNKVVLKKIRSALVGAFGSTFEEVILGGAPFNPEVEAFLRKIHFPFTVGYGMTECGPIITYAKWHRTKAGSCGVPVPGCAVRIDSPDPKNIPGEVQVKGDNVFSGYYRNEEATANAFTADGWFRTGDMGVVDDEGYLYLRGRSKCMILGPNGQNIYPEELEAVINNMTYIVDSLVIEDKGSLVALVYPDFRQGALDGMEPAQLEESISASLPQINKLLPVYAQVKRMEFLQEDFERTPKKSIKRYLYQRG